MTLGTLIKYTWKGQSVTRAYLNWRLESAELRGRTLDLGSGNKIKYLDFVPRTDDCTYVPFDSKLGEGINFESDQLPFKDEEFDTVILLNVLEHIFNYQHLSDEVQRITTSGGHLIGFVPFLMRYHGDPHDFFRYTHESLELILKQSGWNKVEIEAIGMGPFIASAHQFSRSLPMLMRLPMVPLCYFADKLFLHLRPHAQKQYVLGYFFTCQT